MDFTTTVAAIALGYMLGRFTYERLLSSIKPDPTREFLEEMARAKKENE